MDITGPWVGGGSNGNIERDGGLKPGELPLLPWAKELMSKRLEKDEPYTACLPMSVPRVNPYPWKFALSYTSKGLSHIYVLHETGDAGAHRVVYMDGRPHPPDPIPTWWGHSTGKFEKDTLVIDTVGYNDKFWFDSRGTPHTEQLHTVERWTRINYGRITNDFLLDDPGGIFEAGQSEVHRQAAAAGSEDRRRRPDGVHLSRRQRVWCGRRLRAWPGNGHQVMSSRGFDLRVGTGEFFGGTQ